MTAVSQLLTVPYAFYAARSTRATIADSVSGGLSETDPNFNSSIAAGITAADTARWNLDLVDDADNNPTNEIQTLTAQGNTISLSNGGGSVTLTERDSIFTNSPAAGITTADTARWNIDLVDDADNNPTNEIQTLTAQGNTISLSNGGGSVTLTERDSIFANSTAAGITTADTARWNNGGNDWKLSGNAGTNPGANFIGTLDTQDFVVKTNNVERMRVLKNGDIGIGTNTPNSKFNIIGEEMSLNGWANACISFTTGSGLNRRPMGFYAFDQVGQNEWFVGRPYWPGNGTGSDQFAIQRLNTTVHTFTSSAILDGSGNPTATQRFFCIKNNGFTGIGTNTPDQLLSVNGNASKAGGGAWATFSDRRVKQDIKPFTAGLSVLKQLNPVSYRYNEKSGYTDLNKTFIGFIAQDVEKVAPYMVNIYDDKAGPSGLSDKRQFDESALSKIMLNAIKEQQEMIEKQQKTIEELNKRLDKLEQK